MPDKAPHLSTRTEPLVRARRTSTRDEEVSATADQSPAADQVLASLSKGTLAAGDAFKHTDGSARAETINRLQTQQGNHFVQRMLALQRDGFTPAPAGPVTAPPAPGDGKAPPVPLPTFKGGFKFLGPNFDAEYVPVGPVPQVGTLQVTHKVFVEFKSFDTVKNDEPYKNLRLSKKQKEDFNWTKPEETKFTADFITSIHKGWSEKHTMHLADPKFSEYRAAVKVDVVQAKDAAGAHTKINALKIPQGLPRYRSFVNRGDHSSNMDIRDPSEPEKDKVRDRKIVRQIKPFPNNSADASGLEPQMNELAADMKKAADPSKPPTEPFGPDALVSFLGRASSTGSKSHNDRLGQQRADAVQGRINALNGWSNVGVTATHGAENASADEEFRRVDVVVASKTKRDVEQNTAAHEFGHMIGLDDEYIEEKPGKDGGKAKFFGDEPDHYAKIKELMGDEAAKETLTQNGGNIMSVGSDVKRGHYIFFLEALNNMTSKSWAVE